MVSSLSQRRLLVVTESLGVGGTEAHLIRVLPRLVARDWKLAIFCLSGRGKRAQEVEGAGIEVFSLSHIPKRKMGLRYSSYIAYASGKLYAVLRQWRPDIVHFYLPGPYLVGAPVAIAAGTPIKVMSRRSLAHYQKNWPTLARLERLLHTKMDAITGNAKAVIGELLNEGVPSSKLQLIYNGVEASELLVDRAEARRMLGLGADAFVGLVLANLHPYKGHRELIEGLAHVGSKLPSSWCILCVGRDEGTKAELEEIAWARGLGSNIRFTGECLDLSNFFAAADVSLLVATQNEGFSNAILESMSAGLPLVVTAVGGNAEAVVDGETGFVVAPDDTEALGNAVLRLARDPALAERLGSAGRSRVAQEFSLSRCVTAHAQLYEDLLTKKANAASRISLQYCRNNGQKARRPLMFAYWGKRGALPQLSLRLARAVSSEGKQATSTFSISTSNELFQEYLWLRDALFPVKTFDRPAHALNAAAIINFRRLFEKRVEEDGTRAMITLMAHVWSPFLVHLLRQHNIRHTVIVHDARPHRGDPTSLVTPWLLQVCKSS